MSLKSNLFFCESYTSLDLEQLQPPTGDAVLDAVEIGAVEGVPLGPDVGVLAEGAVAGAGHVAQHAVVAEVAHAAVLFRVLQVGHAGGVVVDDDVVGALSSGNSVGLQKRPKNIPPSY